MIKALSQLSPNHGVESMNLISQILDWKVLEVWNSDSVLAGTFLGNTLCNVRIPIQNPHISENHD